MPNSQKMPSSYARPLGPRCVGPFFRAILQPVDGAMPQPVIALAVAFGDHHSREIVEPVK